MTEQQIADGWKRGSIARILDAMQMYGVTLADLRKDVDMRDILTTTYTNALPPGHPNVMSHIRVMHGPTGAAVEIAGTCMFVAKEQAMAKLLAILAKEYGYNHAMVNQTQTPILPSVGYEVDGA